MKTLSVVCARAGSKGLKNKCITRIAGKMVIEYSLEYSLALGKDVKTVVSTDIPEVIAYCCSRGIVYIDRNQGLCGDEVRIDAVLADAIEREGQECEHTSIVYGNIPLRYPELFETASVFLKEHRDYDAALTMQNVEKFNPEWMFDLRQDLLPRVRQVDCRRQMLTQKMIHDGHTLIFKTENFFKRYKGIVPYEKDYSYAVFGAKIKPVINTSAIIDIDTEKDLRLAEALLLCRQGGVVLENYQDNTAA